ncbi:MAG TPA: 2-amino-4-hydroxy-6-hydroxymethyldihydropteridine diphosphokinase [Mariprofundaceae bacterium]|nr:2-amino-4-hydroxy-6-hydroxymethyldihydropteridine diphosphokinase [Mariprofundaceae bacterium]
MSAKAEALIGMGSNIEPQQNLQQAAVAVRKMFGDVAFSSVYRSSAVGMEGDDFLNACCLIRTELDEAGLRRCLKALEDAQGRDRAHGSWRPRTLDLDVLMYAGEMVDDELVRYAHAFVPASELVGMNLPEDRDGVVKKIALRL